jgi:aspartyl-tRNA(Asn)/glutamyl-tRNA(Gln) amidotransferase subunit B
MKYEPTIGIETHAQLLTASKMFCSCRVPSSASSCAFPASLGRDRTDYTAAPANSLICPVCLGMPGSLPVINQLAVENVIMTGLALNCRIAEISRFARKNYNYPDLVKGYQISQWDLPICSGGWLEIQVGEHSKRIGIHDVHLEEDTGKLIHVGGQSLIDFNRSGVPLMEIVTEPDFTSLGEVREYVLQLRKLLRYLGVSSGNMEEGAMRFEGNISLHPVGTAELGQRVEIKNLNSLKALLRALEYEIERQGELIGEGGAVHRETRGWNETQGVTLLQRSKEFADDYRYFPEPDLPPLEIQREWVEQIRARMPELPEERSRRFMSDYELSTYDAALLTEERPVADYFEQAVAVAQPRGLSPKTIANWVTGELFRLLHSSNLEIDAIKISPEQLVALAALVEDNVITMTSGKRVLEVMFDSGRAAEDVVAKEGLAQIADVDQLVPIVEQVIAANPDAVAEYRRGKETILRFLMGQVMRATGGKADASLAADLLKQKLSGG